jgi:hypothetical protein
MSSKESLTLWHGSPRKLIGEFLLPHKATDVSGRPENCHDGVYALEKREFAIVMGILNSKGIEVGSTLDFSKDVPEGIVIGGWPKQETVYLYRLSAKTFQKIDSNQWVSHSRVKPCEIIEIKVKNFIHLVRPATDEERANFLNNSKPKRVPR